MGEIGFPSRPARDGYIVHVRAHSGHRLGYQILFAEQLGLTRSTGRIAGRRFFRLLTAKYVLFATIDDEYLVAVTLTILRALRGRPSAGLFLRPQTASLPGLRYWVEKWFFRVARRIPHFRLLTIVPFDLRPQYAVVANGWIHDPELWDLAIRDCKALPITRLSNRVASISRHRPVLAFLGSATRRKGFETLCDFLEGDPGFASRLLVVVAGRVAADLQPRASSLCAAGAIVEDRFLEDDEILSLYGVVDFVWCVYDPSYDQASGIFGRALQTGRTALVRKGSLIEDQARALRIPTISIDPLSAPLKLSQINLSSDQSAKRQPSFSRAELARRALEIIGPKDGKQ